MALKSTIVLLACSFLFTFCAHQGSDSLHAVISDYKKVEVFNDSCTKNWKDNWILDGTRATISHSIKGMDFYAGPEHKNDTCHAVLWTKESFMGDIMIQYEYTKLDTQQRNVNILYIQATGEQPKEKNIHQWSAEREVPSMFKYFHHMNTLHISYAAYPVIGSDSDYVRARRYLPLTKTLKKTDFGNTYENTGLFNKDIPHQVTVVKTGFDLYMHVKNDSTEKVFHWNYNGFPLINEGYIGLRHMYTRGARYCNFRVYSLQKK